MVGALTLGTAVPYLLETVGLGLAWHIPVAAASVLAILGGLLILLAVDDGPFLREQTEFDASMMVRVFREPRFRLTALGYFGHMWELYAFWSLVGIYLTSGFGDGTGWAARSSLIAFFAVAAVVSWRWAFLLLVPGPILGLWALVRLGRLDDA